MTQQQLERFFKLIDKNWQQTIIDYACIEEWSTFHAILEKFIQKPGYAHQTMSDELLELARLFHKFFFKEKTKEKFQ